MRLLIDVDGVVADLMGGFATYIKDRFGLDLNPRLITTHNLSRSPDHKNLHQEIDLDRTLAEFLSIPTCYQDYVRPIMDSREVIRDLVEGLKLEAAFVTATLEQAPQSYASKALWLERHFPGIPIISCPSAQKHWIGGDFAIDDRFDTCDRWARNGVRSFVFRQPWSETPSGFRTFDWLEIYTEIRWSIDALRAPKEILKPRSSNETSNPFQGLEKLIWNK